MSFGGERYFVFLLVTLLAYHLLKRRGPKYTLLLLASWLFYFALTPQYLWVIVLTSAIDFVAGRLIEDAPTPAARRRWLWLSVVSNLGLLGAFKYTTFLVDNGVSAARLLGWQVDDFTLKIILPLGISFHTFQGISYTLDVYRGRVKAVRSFRDFALFVAFFPQLVAGPVVRASEFLPQMVTPPRVTFDQVVEGLHWFVLGLFKKMLIADRLAQFVDPVFADPGAYDAATLRWAILAYAGQIYCDFSGYSDMAIGCAKWFGFELPQNFNFPYLARNIADFWRRWHMSLSTWMRDYLYIPLGGSRKGVARTYANLILTMTLCGLWHGASWNYVLWGLGNGLLLAAHRAYDLSLKGNAAADRVRSHPLFQAAAIAGTFWTVCAGLVLVRMESWPGGGLFGRAMCGAAVEGRHFVPAWVPLLVGLVALGHLFSGLREVRCRLLLAAPPLRGVAYAAAVALLVVFAPTETKAFIYFQF